MPPIHRVLLVLLILLTTLPVRAGHAAPPSGFVVEATTPGASECFAAQFPEGEVEVRDVFMVYRGQAFVGTAIVVLTRGRGALLLKCFPEDVSAGDVLRFRRHASLPADRVTVDLQGTALFYSDAEVQPPISDNEIKAVPFPDLRYITVNDYTPHENWLTVDGVLDGKLRAWNVLDRTVQISLRPDTLILDLHGNMTSTAALASGTRLRALVTEGRAPTALALSLEAPFSDVEQKLVGIERATGKTVPYVPPHNAPLRISLHSMLNAEILSVGVDQHTFSVRDGQGTLHAMVVPFDEVPTLTGTRPMSSIVPGQRIDLVYADTGDTGLVIASGALPFAYERPVPYVGHVLRPNRCTFDYYDIDLPASALVMERDIVTIYRGRKRVGEGMIVNLRPTPSMITRFKPGPLRHGDRIVFERRLPMPMAYMQWKGKESDRGATARIDGGTVGMWVALLSPTAAASAPSGARHPVRSPYVKGTSVLGAGGLVFVRAYMKRNGTFVRSYTRRPPQSR